jgi:predicted nucleic acid-binding protein
VTSVLDASAVAAALLDDGPNGQWCDAQMALDDLAAPALMPFEVANIVRRTEARGAIDASTAARAIANLRALPVDLLPFDPLAGRVWELRPNLTVYDASYVALAEVLGGPLVTLDRKLANAPGARCEVRVAP